MAAGNSITTATGAQKSKLK